jgi:ribonuclease HI
MDAREGLAIIEEIEGNARTISLTVVDEDGYNISKKELVKYLKSVENEPQISEAYFDGGFDDSKETGSAGVVIYYQKGAKKYRVRKNEVVPYISSNNEAEYAAFWVLLSAIEELGVTHSTVHFKGDSMVVLKQLEGEWSCHDELLNKWLDRIEGKIAELKIKPIFTPISRNENKEADQLASQALKDTKIKSVIEIEK